MITSGERYGTTIGLYSFLVRAIVDGTSITFEFVPWFYSRRVLLCARHSNWNKIERSRKRAAVCHTLRTLKRTITSPALINASTGAQNIHLALLQASSLSQQQ
jgi:hypothetical protein